MLLWVWRRRQAPPAKTTSPPNAPRAFARLTVSGSPPKPCCPACEHALRRPRCAFPARRHCGAPRVGVGIRWPPRSTIVPRRSVTTMAGPDWAICGPTASKWRPRRQWHCLVAVVTSLGGFQPSSDVYISRPVTSRSRQVRLPLREYSDAGLSPVPE